MDLVIKVVGDVSLKEVGLQNTLPTELVSHGGEGGIRTHGSSRYAGFQDQCLRPLGHLSLTYLILTNSTLKFRRLPAIG